MTETEFCEALTEALMEYEDEIGFDGGASLASTASFAEAGLLTMDEGLVVTMADGSESQLTVRRSR